MVTFFKLHFFQILAHYDIGILGNLFTILVSFSILSNVNFTKNVNKNLGFTREKIIKNAYFVLPLYSEIRGDA